LTAARTACARVYRDQLREILEHKQVKVARAMLRHWCACVMRAKFEPMKLVATMVRNHLGGIVAWAHTGQASRILETINGLFQTAK